MYRDFRSGVIANLPVAISVMAYGSVLGMLSAQKNIIWSQLLFMNVSVFAGSAQFVMVDMWKANLPILEITIAVFIINLRYLLMGAALRPVFEGKSLCHKMVMMHLVADENWAVTMAEQKKRDVSSYFLLGGGVCLMLSWTIGTLSGLFLGAIIKNPEIYALDFAFVAVFTALAFSMWQGKRNIIPWVMAAVLAIGAESLFPGKWYIVVGGIGGACIEAFLNPREN